MKKTVQLRYSGVLHRFLLLTYLLLTTIACKKEESDPILQTGPIQLSGSNEVPAVATTGSGVANFSYNRSTRKISFTISWALGNESTNTLYMHLHGSPTSSTETIAPIVVGLPGAPSGKTGFFTGTTRELIPDEEGDLLAGKWYLNIHSDKIPSGELRGQVVFP